jgi:hypothetical protein
MDTLARKFSQNQVVMIPGAAFQSKANKPSPQEPPDFIEKCPPTIPENIDLNNLHPALGSSVKGLEVVVEQLSNFEYQWRQVYHGVLCVPPSSAICNLAHEDARLMQ